jgi:hypothetical protein
MSKEKLELKHRTQFTSVMRLRMKKTLIIGLLSGLYSHMALADSKTLPTQALPEITGFDCAKEVQQMIGLIGRGDNFPQFLATDIETELNRQHADSKLLKMECIGEPVLKAATVPIVQDGKTKQAISSLSITFPLEIIVNGGKTSIIMQVDQNYLVENFDSPENRKVTQNFIVKQ